MNENAVRQKERTNMGEQEGEVTHLFLQGLYFLRARDVAEASQCLSPS